MQGLLKISLTWPINALDEIDISSWGNWSKKHALAKAVGPLCHPPKPKGGQDALFHGQGRSQFGARSVLTVRERERREERQVCKPEGPANWRERRWRLLRPGSGHVFSTFP